MVSFRTRCTLEPNVLKASHAHNAGNMRGTTMQDNCDKRTTHTNLCCSELVIISCSYCEFGPNVVTAMHCNVKAQRVQRRSGSIMHQPIEARIPQSIFRQSVNIYQCFSKYWYCACAETLFPPKNVKILTPLD